MIKNLKLVEKKTFVKFIFWGSINTAINYPIFPTLFYYVFNENFIITSITSTVINITLSFIIQRKFTFRSSNKILKEYVKFFFNTLSVIILLLFLLYYLINVLCYNAYLAQAIVTIIGAFTTYILHKYVTFRR